MLQICFTYTSSEVCPSVYLLLFFRMTGIYMYERYFDSDIEKQELLLDCLSTRADGSRESAHADYDLELFYITNSEELEKYVSVGNDISRKRVIVCTKEIAEMVCQRLHIDVGDLVVFQGVGMESLLLMTILNYVKVRDIISFNELQDLESCLLLYQRYRVWELSMEGRFFYALSRHDNECEVLRGRYAVASKQCFEQIMKNGGWENKATLHQQYAFLNLAYEGNLYCIRSGISQIYTKGSLAEMCSNLVERQEDKNWRECFCLLAAQVFDDLLKDYNRAIEYYMECCNDFNAYAYYRKGIIFQEHTTDFEKMLKYFEISVCIYPEYYRAWYQLGRCYMRQDRYREALEAFRNVRRILEAKLNEDVLRPMEIEYLFKAQNQCAYICNKVHGNLGQAVIENRLAVKTWKTINTSTFFQMIGYTARPEKLWERVRRELCVNKIYSEIIKLAERLEDDQLKKNTQADMAACMAGGCSGGNS